MLTIKAKLGEDLRRFQLSDGLLSWAALVQELLKRFALPDTTTLLVFYKNTDDELVHISNDAELKEALICALHQSSSSLRLELSVVEPLSRSSSPSQTILPLRHTPSPIAAEKIPDAPISLPKEAHQQPQKPQHIGVVCDGCKSQIWGVRYKCGHCPDFDLCESCEATNTSHPQNHLFIKIKYPLLAAHSPSWHIRQILLPWINPPQPTIFTPPAFCPAELTPIPTEPIPTPIVAPAPSSPVLSEPPSVITAPPVVEQKPEVQQPAEPLEPEEPKCVAKRLVEQTTPVFDAKFVADKSINDGTIIPKGSSFTKIWRMRNTGDTKWPMGTRLVCVGGNAMGKLQSFMVIAANPSEEIDASITLTAPNEPGRYISHWRLQTPGGQRFGHRVWCDIVVQTEQPAPLSSPPPPSPEPTPMSTPERVPRLPDEPCLSAPLPVAVAVAEPVITPVNDERYEEQMKQVLQMGFADRTKNFRLLKKYNGDVPQTVAALLEDAERGYSFSNQ